MSHTGIQEMENGRFGCCGIALWMPVRRNTSHFGHSSTMSCNQDTLPPPHSEGRGERENRHPRPRRTVIV